MVDTWPVAIPGPESESFRGRLTDPLAPVALLVLLLAGAAISGSIGHAWLLMGAITGYSLSGST